MPSPTFFTPSAVAAPVVPPIFSAAWVVAQGSSLSKKVQSGYLYSYALVMLLGLVGAISWAMVG